MSSTIFEPEETSLPKPPSDSPEKGGVPKSSKIAIRDRSFMSDDQAYADEYYEGNTAIEKLVRPKSLNRSIFGGMMTNKAEMEMSFDELFNGLDNFGDDGQKWKEAVDFIDSSALVAKAQISACILVLEKPSHVLFSGIIGKDRKTMRNYYNKVIKLDKSICKGWEEVEKVKKYSNSEEEFGKAILNFVQVHARSMRRGDDGEVIKPKNITAEEDDWQRAMGVLKENLQSSAFGADTKDLDDKTFKDIINKGKLVRLDVAVSLLLPQITDMEYGKMDAKQRLKMDRTRDNWPKEFKMVNVSRAKRVALLSMFFAENHLPLQELWVKKYGKPPNSKPTAKMNKDTTEIFEKMMKEMVEGKKHWNKASLCAREIFNFRRADGKINTRARNLIVTMMTFTGWKEVRSPPTTDDSIEVEDEENEGEEEE
jgi:hypothetical protein